MPQPPMTANQFTNALAKLGLDDASAGAALDSDERTIRRWRTGERGIPGPAAMLVRLWIQVKLDPRIPTVVKVRILPAAPEPATT